MNETLADPAALHQEPGHDEERDGEKLELGDVGIEGRAVPSTPSWNVHMTTIAVTPIETAIDTPRQSKPMKSPK
jgi:hypothetical protein